jgi:archaeosine-15-forming tRNA-guanine transglycosylase
MNRVLYIAIVLAFALCANAADRFARDPEQITVATTGRIIKVDGKAKTLRVRGSDGQTPSVRAVSQNFSQMMTGLKQRIGVTLPGGITIAFPGRAKNPIPTKTDEIKNNLDEYTVVMTDDTVYQDGADSIRFDDFKNGEVISIHGSLNGSTLTATRIAKWF